MTDISIAGPGQGELQPAHRRRAGQLPTGGAIETVMARYATEPATTYADSRQAPPTVAAEE